MTVRQTNKDIRWIHFYSNPLQILQWLWLAWTCHSNFGQQVSHASLVLAWGEATPTSHTANEQCLWDMTESQVMGARLTLLPPPPPPEKKGSIRVGEVCHYFCSSSGRSHNTIQGPCNYSILGRKGDYRTSSGTALFLLYTCFPHCK